MTSLVDFLRWDGATIAISEVGNSIYERITDQIIRLIEENRTLPWSKPWSVSMPANAISGRAYRGINAIILAATAYSDHRWVTFRQALNQGGNIRMGEKATQVVLWKFDDDRDEDGAPKRSAPLVRTYSVFNVAQTENLNLPVLPALEVSAEPLAAAERMLAGYVDGPKVVYGGDRACYVPSLDRVEMPSARTFVSGERYFGTLAHELIHSSGSAKRLARPGITDPIYFHSETYALEELVAEIGAAFLCAENGIANTVEQSAAYVDGWLDALKRDRSMVFRASSQAQMGVDLIQKRHPQYAVQTD